MKKNPAIAVIIAIVAIAVLAVALYGAWNVTAKEPVRGALEPVVIGMEPNLVNSLIIIAGDKGFFTGNGLNVTVRNYPSGAAAVDGMLKGESDIATATEFVLAGKALTGTPVSTFASIDRFQQIYLVGRKDRGIENISDLKGKKVGVPLKTAGEFYFGRFLTLHGIGMGEVAEVNVPPQQSADAIANGSVDAIVAWQPNVKAIETRLVNGTLKWPAQGGQPAYCVVIATSNWTSTHPDTVNRFVHAIQQAESYVASHPDDARAIVQKHFGYDDTFMDSIWPDHQFALKLDQSLVLAMEDEARWEIANKLTNATAVPDFRQHIYANPLESLDPGSVAIIQ